jgi:hypothetical protein
MSETPSDTTGAGEQADPSASPAADRPDKLRLRIAGEAGRMLADRGGDARRAGFRAARRLGRGWVPPQHLPDAGEIRRETERALEHSLQVFERVSEECPWDEELLTAALVHDIGLAIDRANAVAVALEELADLVTDRTRWLVEMLPVATALHAGTLGHRARHRLEEHPDYDSLRLLESADRRGHVRSGEAPTLEEAIEILRGLDSDDGAQATDNADDDDAQATDDA